MKSPKQDSQTLKDWTVYPKLNLIKNHESEKVVKPRLMRLLEFFIQYQNEVVTKDQLLDYVWEGRLVTENLLTKSISELRKLLKSYFKEAFEIETIRNVGYRFKEKERPNDKIKPEKEKGLESTKEEKQGLKKWTIYLLIPFTLILIFLSFQWFNTEQASISPVFKTEKITSLQGQEINPAFSPDGKNMAFAWRTSSIEPFRLYVSPVEAVNPRKLTDSPFSEYCPVWTADGQHIIFLRRDSSKQLVLIQKSVIGKGEKVLHDLTEFHSIGGNLKLTTDGEKAIFSAQKTANAANALFAFDRKTETIEQWTFPPDGIIGDIMPTLKEDKLNFIRAIPGNSVFSSAAATNGKILEYDPLEKTTRSITQLEGEITGFLYHPYHQKYFAWTLQHLGSYTLWEILENGEKNAIATTKHGMPRKLVAFPPDKLSYEYWKSIVNVHRYPLVQPDSANTSSTPYLHSTTWDWGLTFAKNKNKAAFFSFRSGYPAIWVASANMPENASKILEIENAYFKSMSFSPDGKNIAFLQLKNNQTSLHIISSHGEELVQISNNKTDYAAPEWSADGQYLYYSSNQTGKWQLYQYHFTNRTAQQLTQNGAYKAIPSPTDSLLLYYVQYEKAGLWQYDFQNKEEILVKSISELKGSINWTISDKGMYYLNWKAGGCYLNFYDFETQNIQSLMPLEEMLSGISALTLSSDFQEIYIAKGNSLAVDIIGVGME